MIYLLFGIKSDDLYIEIAHMKLFQKDEENRSSFPFPESFFFLSLVANNFVLFPYFLISSFIYFHSLGAKSAQEFCSVGDDSCLILWDARSGTTPAIKVRLQPYICENDSIFWSILIIMLCRTLGPS